VHHPSTPVVDQPRCRAHRPPPPTIEQPEWLLPGEHIHAETTADAWRYLALDVPYDRRTLLFGGPLGFLCAGLASMIGNRRARLVAETLAAPQWRYLGRLPIIATNRRLLIEYEGAWWPIWFEMVERCEVTGASAVLTFHGDDPYCLQSTDLSFALRLARLPAIP